MRLTVAAGFALVALLGPSVEATATVREVMLRLTCQSASPCGTCNFPRCCGPTADVDSVANVCLDGEVTGRAVRDFSAPAQFALAADARGNVFAASNKTDSVYRITPGGCVTTVLRPSGDGITPVDGARGLSVDAQGSLYVANGLGDTVYRVTPDGGTTKLLDVSKPLATVVDGLGNLFVSGQDDNKVIKLAAGATTPTTVLDVAGDGAGNDFKGARGLAVDAMNNLYAVAETSGRVFKVTPDGAVSVLMGAAGMAEEPLVHPFGIAVDAAGAVYVTSFGDNANPDRVFRIPPGGAPQVIFADGPLDGPREIYVDDAGRVYVTGQNSSNVIRLTPSGGGAYTHEVLLQGDPDEDDVEPGLVIGTKNGNFKRARGLAVDRQGRVYVAGEKTSDVFQFTETSTCGNGAVDVGETCDVGLAQDRCCCGGDCQLQAAGSVCGDGLVCNGDDRCDANGDCTVHAGSPCPGPDGDANARESCAESTGTACTAADPNGSACDDGTFCNGADHVASGECIPSGVDPCPPPGPCAGCNEANGGTCFAGAGTPCPEDALTCSVTVCDGAGSCVAAAGHQGLQCDGGSDCRLPPTCSGQSTTCPASGLPKQDGTGCARTDCGTAIPRCRSGECACDPVQTPAGCGNAEWDDGEECDLGSANGSPDSCCLANCRFTDGGVRCRANASTCEKEAQCTGSSAECPANEPEPNDKPCSDGNACTVENTCDGAGICSPGTFVCSGRPGCVGTRCSVSLRRRQNRNQVVVQCQVDDADVLRAGVTTCAATGFVPIAAVQTDVVGAQRKPNVGSIETSCQPDPSDVSRYVLCKSQQKELKKLGSPVLLPCKLTGCGKAVRRALLQAAKSRGASALAATSLGVSLQADLTGLVGQNAEGPITTGQIDLGLKPILFKR